MDEEKEIVNDADSQNAEVLSTDTENDVITEEKEVALNEEKTDAPDEEKEVVSQEEPKKQQKKNFLAVIICAIVVVVAGGVFAGMTLYNNGYFGGEVGEWKSSLEEAKISASDNDKKILLVFTGTEWDETSVLVKENILDSVQFRRVAARNYELVSFDIPADDSDLANGEVPEYYMAAMVYGLQMTPAYMLLDAEGNRYASISHDETIEKPCDLTKAIKNIEKNIVLRNGLKEKIATAEGLEKAKLIDKLYEATSIDERSELIEYIQEYPTLDPENKTKALNKYKLQITYFDATSYMNSGDFEGAKKLFMDMTEDSAVENEYKQEAFYAAASIEYMMFSMGMNANIDSIIELLEKSIDIDPESELAESSQYTLDQLYQLKAAVAAEAANQNAADPATAGEGAAIGQ